MALRQIRIGNLDNVTQYDDADFDEAIETDQPIKAGAPTDPTDVLRLGDLTTVVLSAVFPIGCVYLSIVSTNPNTLLGFGTWARIAEGQYLVGFKTADADFGVVEAAGGNKTHIHPVDVGVTTSGASSANALADNNGDGTTFSAATGMATHDVDPASVNSGDNNNLPPFFVIYSWKRTA